MSSVEVVASHRLDIDTSGVVIDIELDGPFDVHGYSQMKYGNREVTRQFAHELTGHMLEIRPELIDHHDSPSFFAPFSVVPPVPFYLSRYALEVINERRDIKGYEPGRIVQIDKSRTQTTNYAAMSVEERKAECDSIDFFFRDGDHPHNNTPAVILDDVRITGTVVGRLLGSVFTEHNPDKLMLGFVAVVEPAVALEHPQIEDQINGTGNKSVEDILPLILDDNFDLNIRTLKLILSTEPDVLAPFLEKCPIQLLQKMLRDSRASGPDFVRYHVMGFRCLQEVCGDKGND